MEESENTLLKPMIALTFWSPRNTTYPTPLKTTYETRHVIATTYNITPLTPSKTNTNIV